MNRIESERVRAARERLYTDLRSGNIPCESDLIHNHLRILCHSSSGRDLNLEEEVMASFIRHYGKMW
jgi:hypothetical protein